MPLNRRLRAAGRWIRDFLYGALYHQLYLDSMKYASSYRDFILFMLYSDLLGAPLFSNTLTLRLLPYVLGELYGWKARVLREKDLTDVAPEIG